MKNQRVGIVFEVGSELSCAVGEVDVLEFNGGGARSPPPERRGAQIQRGLGEQIDHVHFVFLRQVEDLVDALEGGERSSQLGDRGHHLA